MNLNVPPKTAGEEELFEFARAFDGYEHWGKSAIRCFCEWEERFVCSGELPEGPADLRAALYFAWRTYNRAGGPGPFSVHGSLTSFFYAALEPLRQQVLASRKYFFRCKFCQEICNTGHRYSKDICQGCATRPAGAAPVTPSRYPADTSETNKN